MLAELEALALRLGVVVRVESFDSDLASKRGGLCRVNGRALLLVDESLPTADRIAVLAEALARFDLEGIYLSPRVRDRIEAVRAKSA
jgi:hypothetical protein